MPAESGTEGHAQFWWAENVSADHHACNVDVYDASLDVYRPDIYKTISETISGIDHELRLLSLDIHSHPELKFQETYAHDTLTAFMEKKGWDVKKHYHLDTAWVATFSHGNGGRVLGVNSEMDALPGIGHGCGHNLIAIAGVAVAIAVKAALIKYDIPGKVILLGTPAEEGGQGKVMLLEKGAYEEMHACLMCHPAPGPERGASLSSSLSLQRLSVEYRGHTAHAALSPWQGQNALDAAVAAYTNVALLRQQVKPSHRIHGVFEGKDWAANIIPDNAKMLCGLCTFFLVVPLTTYSWYVRAPTVAEVRELDPRVQACFQASALATGCNIEISGMETPVHDLRQNKALGETFSRIFRSKTGPVDHEWGISSASTDFGNVTYALPSIHPGFSIPTEPNGGNHTPAFTSAAATPEAHQACLEVCKALALTGLRVIQDDQFYSEVRVAFEKDTAISQVA
ncbi:aminoacylase 1-like protein 2 [Lactarius akahatsu]|uniref:Peptidase M20 domain-containing protein 2 n=1 Tax=Lactarius akahatsu TaxID=416441 RepID=A0AAD4LRN4_9AGAM|nr:aminoacylase 1-like protein 2 [Lactarius akahatsu]